MSDGASEAIIAISADAIITTDEAQRILRFNRGAEEIFGYQAAEVIGEKIELLIPQRFRASHPAQVRGFAASPIVARRMGERNQISGLRKNGQEFPAEASISKTQVNGEWLFTVALRDVTERVHFEQAQTFLAQATALLNGSLEADQTLESIATLSIPVLADWCVVFLGSDGGGLRRALAVHTDPAHARDMQALRDVAFQSSPAHPLTVALTEGRSLLIPHFGEGEITTWGEGDRHLEILRRLQPASMVAVPLRAREHNMGAICFFRGAASGRIHTQEDMDLAEELARRAAMALDNARLYAEAQGAVAARDDVLAVVSHDLGNPLAAIRLSSTLLLKQIPGGERTAAAALQQVDNIRASVFQMERLIKDLLDIKRIEAGFLALDRERILVRTLLDEVIEAYTPLAAARALTLQRATHDEVMYVSADHERLQQVFSNLIGNAIKFTSAGGSISVGATRRDHAVEIGITDTGPGIPAEHLPHIFNRFWQASRTGRHGIGLGLAIVKGIVDAHGGGVHIESELGVGSTFTIILPLA